MAAASAGWGWASSALMELSHFSFSFFLKGEFRERERTREREVEREGGREREVEREVERGREEQVESVSLPFSVGEEKRRFFFLALARFPCSCIHEWFHARALSPWPRSTISPAEPLLLNLPSSST